MKDTKQISSIISLVGPKHSGKSSVGKALSSVLCADFMDLDSYIEEQTGKSPRVLYKEGVDVFRRAELASLQTFFDTISAKSSVVVLAAGGGICDNAEAVVLLKEKTAIINLEVSSKTAWERILETSRLSGELPPFLQTDNPENTHRELHERRFRAYKKLADYTVNTEDSDIENIAEQIKQLLI